MKNKHGFSIHTHYAKLVVFITGVGDYIQCQIHFHGVNSYHNIMSATFPSQLLYQWLLLPCFLHGLSFKTIEPMMALSF